MPPKAEVQALLRMSDERWERKDHFKQAEFSELRRWFREEYRMSIVDARELWHRVLKHAPDKEEANDD